MKILLLKHIYFKIFSIYFSSNDFLAAIIARLSANAVKKAASTASSSASNSSPTAIARELANPIKLQLEKSEKHKNV